jgi:hypothetical protein
MRRVAPTPRPVAQVTLITVHTRCSPSPGTRPEHFHVCSHSASCLMTVPRDGSSVHASFDVRLATGNAADGRDAVHRGARRDAATAIEGVNV